MKKKLSVRPSDFTKAFIPIEGQKFKFKDERPGRKWNWREYLYPIYDNLYSSLVLRTARQVEKSTTLSNRHITYSSLIPYFRSIYVSPTSKQTRRFSNDRLRKSIRSSDFIQKYYLDKTTTDQVFEKTLINNATIFLGYAYHTADTMRGLSGDMLNIDEYQDMLSDNIPVLKETLTASEYQIFAACGTPKTFDNPLEKLWQQSTQNIWIVPCKSCNTYNRMDTEPEKMVTEKGLVCKNCGKPIDTRNGQWYSLAPENRTAGFHISQLQTGRLTQPKKWEKFYYDKFLKYPEDKLYNEVFGLSYDSADKPISISKIKNTCTGFWLEKADFDKTQKNPLYMGVDWGENKGSFNAAVVGGFIDGKFHVVHIKKFDHKESADPDHVLDELEKMYHRFRCNIMACDHGAGHKENLRLQRRIGGYDKVWEIYHSGNQKQTWNWKPEQIMYVTNRTKAMDSVIFPIQNQQLIFPPFEYMERKEADDRAYYEDYTALTREYSDRLRRFKYDHDTPDDIMQATVYAKFAAHIDQEIPFK